MSDSKDPSDSNPEDASVRIDAWTWAVRLFKTRSLAAAACKKEHVLVNGQRCRPSRRVRVGDRIEVKRDQLLRTFEVKALLEKRVGAAAVSDFAIDLTPPEVYAAAEQRAKEERENTPKRERGTGRPTKRDRRDLEGLLSAGASEEAEFADFVRAAMRPK